jgi:hypothetical protein
MRSDGYGEMFLWNRELDRLRRVLQRLESASIWSRHEMKAYKVRLEEIRAGLNADFAEAMAARERGEQSRLRRQRSAWENRSANGEANGSKQ